MKILCKNCSGEFDYNGNLSGAIEYVKCENVFKIIYNIKILCPHCMSILKPHVEGKGIVGVSVQTRLSEERKEEPTKIKESDDLTKTRKATLAKAFDEVKKHLIAEGRNPDKAFADEETQNLKKIIESKADPTVKSLKNHLEKNRKKHGWHLKISKKQGKFLKRLGFILMLFMLATSLAQVIPELILTKESHAVTSLNTNYKSPPPLIIQSSINSDANLEKGDVINLEELDRLFDKRSLDLPKPEINEAEDEPITNKVGSNIRFEKLMASLNPSSGFGYRKDPFKHSIAFHTGIDIPRPYRAPIRAVEKGIVVYSGYKSGYGNLVVLQHEGGLKTYYGHNAKNTVLTGNKVEKGEIIGYVGMTGRTTGPHLHFEVRKYNKPSNPIDFLRKAIKLSGKVTL